MLILEVDTFSDTQNDAIHVVTVAGASLSIVGGLFLVLSYALFPDLRNFVFRIIVIISTCDVFTSISYLAGYWDKLCDVQAILQQFFGVATFLWVLCFGFVIFQVLVRSKANEEKNELYYHLFVWILAGVSLFVNEYYKSFDKGILWCWISSDHMYLRLFTFYVPLVFTFFANMVFFICVIHTIRNDFRVSNVQRRLTLYLVVFFVVRLWSVINRAQNLINPDHPIFFLNIMHAVFSTLQGFLFSLVFGVNQKVRDLWKMACLSHCCCPCCPCFPQAQTGTDDMAYYGFVAQEEDDNPGLLVDQQIDSNSNPNNSVYGSQNNHANYTSEDNSTVNTANNTPIVSNMQNNVVNNETNQRTQQQQTQKSVSPALPSSSSSSSSSSVSARAIPSQPPSSSSSFAMLGGGGFLSTSVPASVLLFGPTSLSSSSSLSLLLSPSFSSSSSSSVSAYATCSVSSDTNLTQQMASATSLTSMMSSIESQSDKRNNSNSGKKKKASRPNNNNNNEVEISASPQRRSMAEDLAAPFSARSSQFPKLIDETDLSSSPGPELDSSDDHENN
eukprot:TRINITY_DN5397_c0_g1_i1.p1 TRINITY_DN5397_c0_g1~~TRINITY_DN5397_c0_g1_i1.p1  ORF type:complete len:559 (-),score=135.83 TRINITY_DN5397_c0_g1_i1:178-1854(-)